MLDALLGLLRRQAVPIGILALVVLPFLTYYISSSVFFRRANTRGANKVPPTVPYFVPGLFHATGIVSLGPRKYFAELLKDYGGFAPFKVRAGPVSYVVLRDPGYAKEIVPERADKIFAWIEHYDKACGAPKAALDLHRGKSIQDAYWHTPQKYLTGAPLVSLVDTYVSILSRNLNDKMFQVGTWTQIEDFWSFLQQVLTRCTMEALFGSALFKQYPRIVRDYWEFNNAVDSFIPGMPRFMVSAASRPRERLHEGIGKWLRTNHSGSEFAKIGNGDPDWDEHKGSKFIQERDDSIAKIESLDLQARTAEMLSVMHETNSPLIPSTFWTILEVLRVPALAEHLSANIAVHCPPSSSTYNIPDLINIPLLASLHTEVKRLRTATTVVRKCEPSDVKLDGQWSLPRSTPALCFSHDVSLDTERWASARPHTVEKPLEEFWAERFLVPDTKALRSKRQNKIGSGSFSVEGLETQMAVLDDINNWVGPEFAMAMQMATLAVVLNEFEVQICEPEWVDAVMPRARELAYGTVKPLDKIAVRVRKRKVQ